MEDIIRYKDFGLIPNDQGCGFDVVRFVEARRMGDGNSKHPTGEKYIKTVEIGYAMRFETVVKSIAHYHSIDGLPKDPQLKDYVDGYKKAVAEVDNFLSGKLP